VRKRGGAFVGRRDPIYDIFIVGGGINGCGIARDAAGRGFSAFSLPR
jgi:glycerol-3-phosphate dehydrogenase